MTRPAPTAVALVLASLLCGCYTYAPAGPAGAGVPAGAELRIELTPLGASRLAALVGPRAVRVEGRFQSLESDGAVVITPRLVHSMDGARAAWSGDASLRLPPDAVASYAVRRFSRRRTLVLAGAAATTAIGIGAAAVRWGGDKGGGSDNPPPAPPP